VIDFLGIVIIENVPPVQLFKPLNGRNTFRFVLALRLVKRAAFFSEKSVETNAMQAPLFAAQSFLSQAHFWLL
jgi:hypothetical protein